MHGCHYFTTYYLNPAIKFGHNMETTGNNAFLILVIRFVIGKVVEDLYAQARILEQIKYFREESGSFSNRVTLHGHTNMMFGKSMICIGEKTKISI